MQNKHRKKGVNNKSTTSCLCAETTLILHAPAVTVETDMHISEPTPQDFDPNKKNKGKFSELDERMKSVVPMHCTQNTNEGIS